MTFSAEVVSEALVVWIGYGQFSFPRPSNERVAAQFGDFGPDLMHVVRTVADDFFASDANRTARDLNEMERAATARFRRLHPEISARAIEALAWCYTFDNR